jgi:hypothetical protein
MRVYTCWTSSNDGQVLHGKNQPMNPSRVRRGAAGKITQDDVKICALCGTLNHRGNAECWTCRWSGAFSDDARTITLAWQRLEVRYEGVRPEHVLPRRVAAVGDFGALRRTTLWQKLTGCCRAAWQGFQARRDLRAARREAGLKKRQGSRPDGLGV